MQAKDAMTRRIVSVHPETPIVDAIGLMLHGDISGLPVVDAEDRLVGIVTEGDFLRRAETGTERQRPRWLEFLRGPGRLAGDYVHTHGRRVDEVMTREVVTATEETPLEEVVRLMERHHVKRVPIVADGKLCGIVSRTNLLAALLQLAAAAPPSGASDDAALRERIVAALRDQPWSMAGATNVTVTDGVVELSGAVFNDEQRQAMRVVAENIPGVKAVRDHLAWIEPTSGFVVEPPEDEAATGAAG
jgi:CBS domain-containing protein